MKTRHPEIGLDVLCRLFGISRQSYYQHFKREKQAFVKEAVILKIVNQLRKRQPKIGTRKLYFLLQKDLKKCGLKVGRDALFELLGRNNMLIKRHRNKIRTTYSYHWFKKYPNLLKNGLLVEMSNRVWVSDITYLPVGNGFCYLSLLTDVYSRKILGYNLSTNLKASGSINTLLMAIEGWDKRSDQLIHHSDRGIQYCSHEYIEILKGYQILISMTENGDPYQNPIAERVNGILKQELITFPLNSYEEAKLEISKAIKIYNYERPHSSCEMLTPDQAHRCHGKLIRYWKNYYQQKNKETVNLF